MFVFILELNICIIFDKLEVFFKFEIDFRSLD